MGLKMHSTTPIPKAISESEITICGVRLRVAVLDNGKRVIRSEDVIALFDAWSDGASFGPDAAKVLAEALHGHES